MTLRCSSSIVLSRAVLEDLLKVMTLPTAREVHQSAREQATDFRCSADLPEVVLTLACWCC